MLVIGLIVWHNDCNKLQYQQFKRYNKEGFCSKQQALMG